MQGASNALVITEGLVVYLDNATVQALARNLAAEPAIRWWMLDLLSPGIRAMISNGMGGRHPARALVKFAPENGVAFFEALGWRACDVKTLFRAAARFRRASLLMRALTIFPDPDPRRLGKARWSAVVAFRARSRARRTRSPVAATSNQAGRSTFPSGRRAKRPSSRGCTGASLAQGQPPKLVRW